MSCHVTHHLPLLGGQRGRGSAGGVARGGRGRGRGLPGGGGVVALAQAAHLLQAPQPVLVDGVAALRRAVEERGLWLRVVLHKLHVLHDYAGRQEDTPGD